MSGYSDRRAALRHADDFQINRAPRPARTQSRWQWCKNAVEGWAIATMIRGLLRQVF